MGYEIMEKDIVEVLDSQTANTESEPTTVENELVLVDDKTFKENQEIDLVEYKCIKEVQAKPMDRLTAEGLGLVRDVTGINEDGYFVKYNEDYSSWTPKKPFEDGYIIPEVAHTCKSKCESCEYEYTERSCV